MFEADRIYSQMNFKTGTSEWMFDTREGRNYRFDSKAKAEKALAEFIKYNMANKIDGGRSMPGLDSNVNKLSHASLDSSIQEQKVNIPINSLSKRQATFDEKVTTTQDVYRL